MFASVLTSSGGIAGAPLRGTANAIGTLKDFIATGSLAVDDGQAMTVVGAVDSSSGNVFLATGTNAFAFRSAVSVVSQPGGPIGILADSISNLGTPDATGAVNTGSAGVFELAPFSPLTLTLGATSGLSLTDTTGITAGYLRPAGLPSRKPRADRDRRFYRGRRHVRHGWIGTLDLEALGTISQIASAPIIHLASLLVSTNNVAGDISLGDTLNSIGGIGNIAGSGGELHLRRHAAVGHLHDPKRADQLPGPQRFDDNRRDGRR